MSPWGGVCWAVVQECDTSYAAGSDHGVFKPVYLPYFVHKCTIERGPVCTYKEVFA